MGKFGLDGSRQCDLFKNTREKLDMADLDQVIDRAGIGDDQPHQLESELFESLPFLLEIFERVFLEDAMGFKEAVHLDASETKHLTQLRFRDAARAEFFKSKGFERPARQIAR